MKRTRTEAGLDFLVIFGDRQAAFFVDRDVFRLRQNLRVDEHPRRALALFLGEIHGDEPQRHRHLNGGKADTWRVIHGFEHVLGERADFGSNFFDRLGNAAQAFVRNADDFTNGHDRDVIAAPFAVKRPVRSARLPRMK